ncbi:MULTISPECIES: P-loop NTPase fold protein [Alteromonas]|jgi:hypothetical protein|uniref:KAP NTPase domain-containing protein n=2 Tax=Alteromonas stellipolaris TaxID=233316 RepID=A0AAW7YZY4_9ALTE|nr:P-loop NTPase fold protein [Alteromonas stellipolaris]MDO6577312.1 hypothetical protein [Alteromonas stellipolaris]
MKSGEKKMHSITQHILSLLDDTSFPPLVMLDGSWGEGKTYFTKKTLIPELQEKGYNYVFFSLTGLSSINDFKDRLLSSSYIRSEMDSDTGKSFSTIFTSIVSQFGGENGGTIASILSGASGLVKESMLSRLRDRVIIIDDLDRVKDKELSNLILGECLQLSDGSNLKFLFIVNDDKSLADAALKEKVFSGIIKLNKSLNEAIEIAFSKYAWFEHYRHEIEKIVEHKNLKNLRVLKRVSKKIDEINKVLQSDKSLDLDGCMTTLIKVTILTLHYHYEHKFSEADIWEKSEHSNMLPDEKNERYKYADLVDVHWFLTKPLISFLVGGSNWSLSIEDFGRLQKKGCPIDSFMFSPHFNHDDESFERKVDALQQFIFEEPNVPFSKWFEASCFYHFLQCNEFFGETRPDISEHFDELFAKKSFDYSDLDGRTNRLLIDPEDKLIFDKFEKEREAYRTQSAQNEKSDVFKRMKKGWSDVDIEIYRSHQLQPFFNQFSAQQLVECLINWENSDILLFNAFISDRYKSTNIKTHLAEECGIISELQKEVEAMYSSEKAGRKKGALGFLKQNLSSAVEVLSGDNS